MAAHRIAVAIGLMVVCPLGRAEAIPSAYVAIAAEIETILLVNNKRPRIIKAQQNVLGTVLEASLIKNKGSAATVII
ncbi:hypothetical protein OC704_02355, partial [Sweet potato little leaf phytoplasma]|uniref:hypothetical protein n=1 Tax=Candidatus Phytoplasma australasiaticum TaxID=2754999 RepID=UPI0030EAAFF6